MAKRRYSVDEQTIAKRMQEGRGKGTGKNYIPWIKVHEVPSKGRSSIRMGWKTGREHHLLSALEASYFFTLEWNQPCTDIREQYPLLPLAETIEIAEHIKVKHPRDPKTKAFIVMSTDFLGTFNVNAASPLKARSVKYEVDRQVSRTQEKLLIEREYWRRRNVDWKVITENSIDAVLVKNIKWIHGSHTLDGYYDDLDKSTYERLIIEIPDLITGSATTPISTITDYLDETYGLRSGVSMHVFKHLICHRKLHVDMHQPILTSRPVILR